MFNSHPLCAAIAMEAAYVNFNEERGAHYKRQGFPQWIYVSREQWLSDGAPTYFHRYYFVRVHGEDATESAYYTQRGGITAQRWYAGRWTEKVAHIHAAKLMDAGIHAEVIAN